MKRSVPRLDGPARAVGRDELIGRQVRVVAARDAGLVGLAGTVIDETLRTLTVRKADGRGVRVGKRGATFEVATPKGPVRLEGAAIEFRPEDRTKKVR